MVDDSLQLNLGFVMRVQVASVSVDYVHNVAY